VTVSPHSCLLKLERERAAIDAARKQLEQARAANEAQEKSRQELLQQQQLAEARRERERMQLEQEIHEQQLQQQQQVSSTPADQAPDCVGSAGGSSPTLKENFFPVQVSLDIRCGNRVQPCWSSSHVTSFFSEGSALGRMVAPAGARAGGGDLGGRSDHYRQQQQQQQQPRRARPDSGSSVSVPTSSAPAIPLQRKETRLVSGDHKSSGPLSCAVKCDLIRAHRSGFAVVFASQRCSVWRCHGRHACSARQVSA
jgi:hypothetical protein